MNFEKAGIIGLIIICASVVAITVPAIGNNIDNPNLIVYFNADEGYLMDLIWSYYSGEIRDSFQLGLDYGLGMIYLSDLSRMVLSKFIEFTPGTFVSILRWIYMLSWIGSLIALWHLVGNHFGKGWMQICAVFLLAVRPAYDYVTNSLKPEPLVLLFMIVGLNYTLKIIP